MGPTTHVEQFNGSLGAFSGVDPIRYNGGLWLEAASENIIVNPWFAVDTTGWSGNSGTLARDTGWAYGGPASGKMVASGAVARVMTSITLPTDVFTAAFVVYHVAGVSRTLTLFYNSVNVVHVPVPSGVPTIIAAPITGTGALASLQIRLIDSTAGDTFWVGYAGVESGAVRTSPAPGISAAGVIQPGYSWTGTAHNSPSTRAASSASVATADVIDSSAGSLAFRFRRLIDTGGIETLLECGTDGASTDYLALTIDASDKLVMAWTANGGSAQTVTSTESIAVDTEYLLYVEWDGTQMALSIDNGALVTGTRDTPQGSWGVGDLVLKAE